MIDRRFSQPNNPSASRNLWVRIGKRLQGRRVQLGLDEDFIARSLGVSRTTYDEFEAGIAKTPSVLLGELARLLAVPIAWFFQEEVDERSVADAPPPSPAPQTVYTVATPVEREEALLACFRTMDLDTQQYLLTIARGLSPAIEDDKTD